MLSPLLLVTEMVRGVLSQLMYANNLVLMSETLEGFRSQFLKWKEAFKGKGMEVSLGKTKVIVTGGITKDGLSKNKVDPCVVCSL